MKRAPMKRLIALFLISGTLFAETTDRDVHSSEALFTISSAAAKAFLLGNGKVFFDLGRLYSSVSQKSQPAASTRPAAVVGAPPVTVGSTSIPYSVIDPVVAHFDGQFPTPPPDPKLIFLDGFGNSLIEYDMTSLTLVSQVVVPTTIGPFGVRPSTTGPETEVWVANGGLQISVADLAAQKLSTNIATPSIPISSQPAGIVFTPDGLTALEALSFPAPDSSGNKGVLFVFDAVKRQLVSTLLLKVDPTAIVMAPDGFTAYLLSSAGILTYYDVLSGTADLALSTFAPGVSGGYGSTAQVYAHPDGTRLFWNFGVTLEVFDLSTHKIVNQFPSGLPTTALAAMRMSQDGGRVYSATL